ncbi:MAG TPA: dienelactone hydrolase family protein [Gammaproteobacteria bacterium]|nr:dienelactone hydrolase family protein [Gammaproteobacteria bacterium]
MATRDSHIPGGRVTLDSGLRCWVAKPAENAAPPGVLLYIEAYGVNAHMRAVADRFAQAGYAAIIPDIFHGRTFDYGNTQSAMRAVRELDDAQVMRESAEALKWLAEDGHGKPAVVGFCMGGRLAFLAAIELGSHISRAVCYYGGGIAAEGERDKYGRRPPIVGVADIAVPLLLHYGGRDAVIDSAEQLRVATALSKAGKQYVLAVYPEAGHAFNCEDRPHYHDASAAEARRLTLAFLGGPHRH